MMEVFKSKTILFFTLTIIGIIFIDSTISVRLEEKVETDNNPIVMANIK